MTTSKLTLTALLTVLAFSTSAQLGKMVKNKVKEKVQETVTESTGVSTTETSEEVESPEEISDLEEGDIITYNGVKFKMASSPKDYNFSDDLGISGYYHFSQYVLRTPSSHFDSDPGTIFEGMNINYNPKDYSLQAHFSKEDSNYAVIPEYHRKSADKGNLLFQFGMQGGPQGFFNVEAIILEPGVILFGANVYHKNDEVGHQWMNNITPEIFFIAAKDTSKIKNYEKNPEYTSKIVFEKFDALKRVSEAQEIEEAKPLPTEGMKDAQLKGEAKNLITKTALAYGWKETVQYAYVNSTDWEIEHHPLTGIPLKRVAKCIVVMKTPDGNYKREGFYIAQDYAGGGNYAGTYMLYNDQRIYYVKPAEAFKYQ